MITQMVVIMKGKAVMRDCTPKSYIKFKEMGYEILRTGLTWDEAERISKDYNIQQGKNLCVCHISNWDSLSCPLHGLGVKK